MLFFNYLRNSALLGSEFAKSAGHVLRKFHMSGEGVKKSGEGVKIGVNSRQTFCLAGIELNVRRINFLFPLT